MSDEPLTPLAPQARVLFYLQALARLVFFWIPVTGVGVATGAAMWSAMYSVVLGLGWLFVLFLIAVWMPALAHARYGYALRDEDLLIARGVLIRSIVAIPTSRIQHVDTRQGPIEQWMGLARLQVHTASGVGGDGMIPGLERPGAEALRDQLVDVDGEDGV